MTSPEQQNIDRYMDGWKWAAMGRPFNGDSLRFASAFVQGHRDGFRARLRAQRDASARYAIGAALGRDLIEGAAEAERLS